jgi:hypothetical protein
LQKEWGTGAFEVLLLLLLSFFAKREEAGGEFSTRLSSYQLNKKISTVFDFLGEKLVDYQWNCPVFICLVCQSEDTGLSI